MASELLWESINSVLNIAVKIKRSLQGSPVENTHKMLRIWISFGFAVIVLQCNGITIIISIKPSKEFQKVKVKVKYVKKKNYLFDIFIKYDNSAIQIPFFFNETSFWNYVYFAAFLYL